MDGPANPSNTPAGSVPNGHYQIDDVGALIWVPGPPPSGYVSWHIELPFEPFKIEFWCLPVMYMPQPVFEVPESTYFAPSVQLLQLGLPKDNQHGRVNVEYMDLPDWLSRVHGLGGAQALEVSEALITKLNDLIEKHQKFCEFFAKSSLRLLELETLLKGDLLAYQGAFRKFGNKKEIMQIYDEREAHSNFELHILNIYQEYCNLVYQSRSLWITTDSVGVTSFIDGQGHKRQVTVKLFPSALCSEKFHISDQCRDALLRKAGFSVDGVNVKHVRWAGEF